MKLKTYRDWDNVVHVRQQEGDEVLDDQSTPPLVLRRDAAEIA
jgi:hypothetical protein